MKSWIVFSVLALAGCGGRGRLPCIESATSEVSDAEFIADPFANLQVQVGVDGSESMQGFVSRPGSRYAQAIAWVHTLLLNYPGKITCFQQSPPIINLHKTI